MRGDSLRQGRMSQGRILGHRAPSGVERCGTLSRKRTAAAASQPASDDQAPTTPPISSTGTATRRHPRPSGWRARSRWPWRWPSTTWSAPIRTVLDIGCGEGAWRAPLLKLRPKLHYLGFDSSEYAIAARRAPQPALLARFGDFAWLRPCAPVDLLVCADVLHYLPTRELQARPARPGRTVRRRGLPGDLRRRGRIRRRHRRLPAAQGRLVPPHAAFTAQGLRPGGFALLAGSRLAGQLAALDHCLNARRSRLSGAGPGAGPFAVCCGAAKMHQQDDRTP
jgi:SAM-dependent methyltransferase